VTGLIFTRKVLLEQSAAEFTSHHEVNILGTIQITVHQKHPVEEKEYSAGFTGISLCVCTLHLCV